MADAGEYNRPASRDINSEKDLINQILEVLTSIGLMQQGTDDVNS